MSRMGLVNLQRWSIWEGWVLEAVVRGFGGGLGNKRN